MLFIHVCWSSQRRVADAGGEAGLPLPLERALGPISLGLRWFTECLVGRMLEDLGTQSFPAGLVKRSGVTYLQLVLLESLVQTPEVFL